MQMEMWTVILGMECLLIILGNVFTISVFYKQRISLKRTRYLLINLSGADLMVGLAALDHVVGAIRKPNYEVWEEHSAVHVFFGSASITSLLQISLERLFALFRPFRHRTTTTKAYIFFIAIGWGFSAFLASIYSIGFLSQASYSLEICIWILTSSVILSLIFICCVYFSIWIHSRKQTPGLPQSNQVRRKHLAKTLFIVTMLSVLTWFPFGLAILLPYVLKQKESISTSISFGGRCLQLANSFLNPIVYCFRMPEFRQTLKRMFIKRVKPAIPTQRRQNVSPWNAPVRLLSFSVISRT